MAHAVSRTVRTSGRGTEANVGRRHESKAARTAGEQARKRAAKPLSSRVERAEEMKRQIELLRRRVQYKIRRVVSKAIAIVNTRDLERTESMLFMRANSDAQAFKALENPDGRPMRDAFKRLLQFVHNEANKREVTEAYTRVSDR